MATNYVCSFCGKGDVKLWRPKELSSPLICACCAEKRQTKLSYKELKWEKLRNSAYHGTPTGRTLPLKAWKVDADGCVPSYNGPGPKGVPTCRTTDLIVSFEIEGKLTQVTLVPAIDSGNGTFYVSIPRPMLNWWKRIPTR